METETLDKTQYLKKMQLRGLTLEDALIGWEQAKKKKMTYSQNKST